MPILKSFAKRLSLNIIVAVAILFIVTLLIVAIFSHTLIAEEAKQEAAYILEANIAQVEEELLMVELRTQNAAALAEENDGDDDKMFDITYAMVANNPFIVGSAIAFDSSYRADHQFFSPYSYFYSKDSIASKLLGTGAVASFEEEWYRVPMETGKPHWSEPYFDEGGGEVLMCTYSYPMKDKSGRVIAVVTADIALDWIDKKMGAIHPYPNSYAVLVSAKGNYLMKGEGNSYVGKTVFSSVEQMNDPAATKLAKEMVAGEKGTQQFHQGALVSFSVYGPLYNGWSMAITCGYQEVLARSTQMHILLIVVGIFALIVMFVICRRNILRLTQPLTEFSVSALNMAKGNFHAKLPEVKTKDEMLRLHDSFEYMQKSINTYIKELRTTTTANERMESELNIARAIQLGMVPKNYPNEEKCQLHAILMPAKEVGGDLYDFLLKDDSLYFAVGDVSGKGVPAALIMAITRSACRFFASMGLEMDRLTRLLNNNVAEGNESNMFATLFTARINLKTYQMQFCNAGHNPIIVIPANSEEAPYYYKAQPNLAVGLFPNFDYKRETIDLQPGTSLIIYTDGVSEAETSQKELFGEDRLLAVVSAPEFRQKSAEEMTSVLYTAVKNFTKENDQNDDITIMAIRL